MRKLFMFNLITLDGFLKDLIKKSIGITLIKNLINMLKIS